ncbi:hypothetical protein BDQ17DRAFT_314300 [Cyathus striatus]|nr:hypothetical protein BDQ17DRAFT_314300 [Cyathus striatus]
MSEGGYGAQHEWGGERVDGPMNQGHAGQQDESHSSRIDAGGWGTPAMDSRQSCRPVKEEGDWDNGVEKPGRLVDERTSRQGHGWSNNEPSHDPWIGPDVDKNHGAHMHRRDESSRPMDRDIPQHHHGKNDYYRGPSNGSGGQRNGYDSRRSHVRDDYSDGPSNGRGGGQRNGYSSHRSHGGDYYSDRPSNGRGFDSHHSGYDSRRPMEDTRRNDQDHAPSHASNSQWSAVQGGRGNAVIIQDDERHQAKDGRYGYHYRSSNRQDFDGRRGGYNSQNSQFSQRPVKQEHQDNGVVDELSHPRDGRGEDFYRQPNGRGYAGHRGGEDSHRPQWSGEPVRNEIRDDNGPPKGPRSNNHRSGYNLPLYTTEGMEHPGRGWHGHGSNRGFPTLQLEVEGV